MNNSILIENIGSRDDLKAVIVEAIREYERSQKPAPVRYASRKQIKEKYGICYPTLDAAIGRGEVTGYRMGGRILIDETSINLPPLAKRHYNKK